MIKHILKKAKIKYIDIEMFIQTNLKILYR